MRNKLKKIVVLGPESTGKSSLCKQLSEHYQTIWVPEYAREFLEKNGTDYSYDDLLIIAKGHFLQETEMEKEAKNNLLFVDTDMNVMKVWCEFVFQKCHSWILNKLKMQDYDLYLLCNTDLLWVKDDLREYPDLETRETLLEIYKNLLAEQNLNWVLISGDYNTRFQKATEAVDSLKHI